MCLAQTGAPAAHMSGELIAELDESILAQYQACWNQVSPSDFNPDDNPVHYKPKLKMSYAPDGSLRDKPVLLNVPTDPHEKKIAATALQVAKSPACNPLKIPAKFAPYYDDWKVSILSFAPDDVSDASAEPSGFFPSLGASIENLLNSIKKAL
ncbi:hypothetical protein DYH55_21960 [Methylovirgula sp. 4M-Z18]|nr:hypothetical protein DYH55_21960 [Methylovirgula sp. 4M-Z18]